MKKILISLLFLIVVFVFTKTQAQSTNCNPIDPKPTKVETRLGTFSISPDIVPVDQIMTIMVKTATTSSNVSISIPSNTELIDYSPKSLNDATFTKGSWQKGTQDLPAGEYSIMTKPTSWTKGKWQATSYSVTNTQGTGQGEDNFFAFYDTIPLVISLDGRNQVAQNTKDVVRKVVVTSIPGVKINLATNKGSVGPTISEKTGNNTTVTSLADGTATFFLFAKEKDKLELTASSEDSCQISSISQQFTIVKSDIARNYTDNSWIWWVVGGLIFIIIIIVIIIINRKPKTEPMNDIDKLNNYMQ